MKILYYIYQICIALPILLVLTILTAIVTIVGSLLGGAHIWGYYPGKIWSQLICLFLLIPVKSCMTRLPIFSSLTIRVHLIFSLFTASSEETLSG